MTRKPPSPPPAPEPETLIAACRFDGTRRTYDYFAPFPVKPGDRVNVRTNRGDVTVTVDHIKEYSDVASASLICMAGEDE